MVLDNIAPRIWQKLTEPSAAITQPKARFQSQATSAILMLTLALGSLVLLNSERSEYPSSLIAILLAAAISYPISRTRYYRLAGLLTIAALWLLPLYVATTTIITTEFVFATAWLGVVAVMFTYVLFSLRASLMLAAVIFGSFSIIPLRIAQGLPSGHLLFFDSTMSAAAIFAVMWIARQFDLKAQRASEAQYRAIVEGQTELMARWLPDTTLTFVNTAYCRFFGKTCDELIGRRFVSLVHPGDLAAVRQHIATITPQNPIRTNERRVLDAAGNLKWYQWTDCGLFDQQGRIIEYQSVGRDVTERKLAEAALRASEEQYRIIVEIQTEMICRWRPDDSLTFVNEAYCRYFGKTRDELLNTSILASVYPDDRLYVHRMTGCIDREHPSITYEHRVLNPAGEGRWNQWTDQAIFDPDGRIIEYQSVGRDITDLKQAEEAEREQREFAEAVSGTAALISSTLNLDEVLDRILNQIVLTNPAKSAEILLIEDGIARVVRTHGEDQQYVEDILNLRLPVNSTRNLREMSETGHTVIIPSVLDYAGWVDTDVARWIRALVGAPIRLELETIGFLVMSSNQENVFTEADAAHLQTFADQAAIAIRNARLYDEIRRYARDQEILVKQRTAELELAQERLRVILDGTGEGILYTEQGKIQYANLEFCRMTGYTSGELVGQFYTILYSLDPRHDHLDDVRLGLHEQGIWRGELQLRRKDSTLFVAGLRVALVSGGSAELVRSVTVVRDISQEKRLRVQQSNLVAYASHELRTPITNLKTRLYLRRRRLEALEEHLTILDAVTERMRQLVEDLLDISRLEHGLIPLRRETLVLQEVIHQVARVQTAEAARRELELQVTLSSTPIFVFADSSRLIQVVTNLITNALNYTSAGGQVSIRLWQEAASAMIEIEDTGIGIAPENLPYIFQPFFRVISEVSGTGLGLSIAKEIIELHGGAISVRSKLGQGSAFQITLPLLTSPEIDLHRN